MVPEVIIVNPLADEHMHVLYNLQKTGIEDLSQCSREELKPYRHLKDLDLIEYGFVNLPNGKRILRAELSNSGKDFLASVAADEKKFKKTHFLGAVTAIAAVATLLWQVLANIRS